MSTSERDLTSRDFPVHWPVLTRWADNDMFGHLNNAVYYELFDTAINGWIGTGAAVDPVTAPWLGVVAESGCRFYAEVAFPERLEVGLSVTRLGNSSVTYRLAVIRPGEPDAASAVAAIGHWVHVYVGSSDATAHRHPGRHPVAAGDGAGLASPFVLARADMLGPMPLVSKTLEVEASAEAIMAIVADFESYPLWNEEIKGCWILAHYDDGRPSQLRLDTAVQGMDGTYIQAVYYPGENQIQTVMQQGDLFSKQEQIFSVVEMGPTSLLTVDLDVEVSMPVPAMMVKKVVNDALDHLADNLKSRAEALAT